MGAPELILIVVAILILIGGKMIPEITKGFCNSMKKFKNAQTGNAPQQPALVKVRSNKTY